MTTYHWPADRRAPLPPVQPWAGRSETLVASVEDPRCTPAEASDFATTPTYDETLSVLRTLCEQSPLIRMRPYGRSAEGRPLTLVVASHNHDAAFVSRTRASAARVLTQCGIHPGEIDGKDAGLMLLRDIAFNGRHTLLDGCDWYFVPVLNPDGHERRSAFSRPNQRGPELQGWRASAQGLNLNRDFVKADSPEMRAVLALIGEIDPDLYVDMHVTDGLDYQYDITYGFQDAPYSASPAISAWLEGTYRPTVSASMVGWGHVPGPLILAADDRRPELGLMLPAFPPRFSHGYGDLRHLATVLVENHSLKPVKQRVLGTYALIEATLALASRDVATLRAATEADRTRHAAEPVLTWAMAEAPVRHVLFHPIASEFYPSPASGAEEVRWLGTPLPAVETPLSGSKPATKIARPRGYWVPVSETAVMERLRIHGIAHQIADAPVDVEVEMIRLAGLDVTPRVSERRIALTADSSKTEIRCETFATGSAYVATDQPLGDLAIHLLEPACADSLFRQGMIAGMLDAIEYMEAYVVAPMADEMLATDPALRAAFDAKLAADPDFAKDPMARLHWFYLRTPYRDERHMLYPIGRVIA